MSELTITQIDKYLSNTRDSIEICFVDFSVNVKTTLSEKEKKIFVEWVVENSYINNVEYSSIDHKNTFIVTFAQMLTNLPSPTKKDNPDVVDIDKLYSIVTNLDLITQAREASPLFDKLIGELKSCIKEEIDIKNQKIAAVYASSNVGDEAIEAVSNLAYRILDGVNKVCDIFDDLKELSKDGKFLKVIPKDKLDSVFDRIQKIVEGFALLQKTDKGSVIDAAKGLMTNIDERLTNNKE